MDKEIEYCICEMCRKKAPAISITVNSEIYENEPIQLMFYHCNCGWESPTYAYRVKLPPNFVETWEKINEKK